MLSKNKCCGCDKIFYVEGDTSNLVLSCPICSELADVEKMDNDLRMVNHSDVQRGEVKIPLKEMEKIEPQEDLINAPNHYHSGGIDINTILEMKFPQHVKGFYLGNVIKYVLRHELKNGVQDLEKAAFNLNKLIELEKAKTL